MLRWIVPWGEARDPAGDVGAIGFVFGAEGSLQSRLFVGEDEEVGCEPGNDCVGEEMQVSKKKGLAEDQRRDCKVHGVSDVAIGTGNDEVPRGKDGGGCADSLEGETGKCIEHHGSPGDDEENADGSEWCEGEEGRIELPTGDPPGDESGDGSGSEDQKSCRPQKGEEPPGTIAGFRAARHGCSVVGLVE